MISFACRLVYKHLLGIPPCRAVPGSMRIERMPGSEAGILVTYAVASKWWATDADRQEFTAEFEAGIDRAMMCDGFRLTAAGDTPEEIR